MRTVVLGEPPPGLQEWLDRRRALGQDLFDEVWKGEYHVAPAPHGRHGLVDDQLVRILGPRADAAGLVGSGPLNLGVKDDYRVPDHTYRRDPAAAMYLATVAIVVEVVSPGDESYAKFDFYAARGVEELLIVDPQRQAVEWYALRPDGYGRAGGSTLLDLDEAVLTAAINWPP